MDSMQDKKTLLLSRAILAQALWAIPILKNPCPLKETTFWQNKKFWNTTATKTSWRQR